MNFYVGNLSWENTEDDVRKAFEAFGQVTSFKIIKGKYTWESRRFAFLEMPNSREAQSAISGLVGNDLKGSSRKVNEARPSSDDCRDEGGFKRGGFAEGRLN